MSNKQKIDINFNSCEEHVEALAESLDGVPAGDGYICFCPAHDDKATGNRSLKVEADRASNKVLLHCKSGCDFKDITRELRSLGLWQEYSRSAAQRLWASASSDTSALLQYFRSRGIQDIQQLPKSIRQHDSLFLSESADQDYCGLVAAIRDKDEKFKTAYKIFLTDDCAKLADVPYPKAFMSGDSPDGGHITIHDGTSSRLHVAEGIETTLAVAARLPKAFAQDRIWAALTADNLRALHLADGIEELWIWADADPNHAGEKAAEVLAGSAFASGIAATIIVPKTDTPDRGVDWLDKIEQIAERSLQGQITYSPSEPWLKDGCQLKSPWFMRDGCIWKEASGREKEQAITTSAVWLRKRFDEFDTSYGVFEIGYIDSRTGQVKSVSLARDIVLDYQKFKSVSLKLANFPVHPSSYKQLSNFFFDCERQASNDVFYTTNRTGWHKLPGGRQEYSPYSDKITHLYTEDGVSERISAITPKGNPEIWVEQAFQVFEHGTGTVWPFAAALAAPLIRLLGIRTFIIDMYGMSSTGKTLSAKFGLSVYGIPSRLMLSFDATDVGIERNAYALNDSLLVLDESQKVEAKRSEIVKTWIYRLGNEQGKEKGKGAEQATQRTMSWKLVGVITGEKSAKSFMGSQWGGIEGRTISVYGSPFSVEDAVWAQELEATLEENCGHLGPIWIEYIQHSFAKISERYARNAALLHQTSISSERIQNRKIPYYALLMTVIDSLQDVLELEYDMIAELWMTIYEHWLSALRLKTFNDMALDALNAVHTYYVENSTRFVKLSEYNKEGDFPEDRDKLRGRVSEDGTISFTVSAFREALRQGGDLEIGSTVDMFMSRGWLEMTENETKRGAGQHSVKLQGKTVRTYTVTGAAFDMLKSDTDVADKSMKSASNVGDAFGDAEILHWQLQVDQGMLPFEERFLERNSVT